MVKNPRDDTGDTRDVGSIPGLGRSPGGGYGNPLQDSCLENPMDRGACWTTVYGVPKSRTRIRDISIHNSLNLIHHCYQHLLDEEKLRLSELKRLSGLNTTL